ncbi:hypothetical protein Hypma_008651 [Hypsizygus marmoreus]|uniref:F-box domain-containing protein n=1 Tax=Hypsizygus marmoreus TaxID=39966 RepID=A0A369JSS0_HYPMA|nr:hypothetical protein Hypma_008651 [Hypsizygus marmoreus]
MLRRSTRKAALRAEAPEDHGVNSDTHKDPTGDPQDASRSEPSRKRRRTNSSYEDDRKKKHVRGRRGALKGLVEMPMDILFEILSHLRSADILRLSWTSKALRGILMSRSSAFVWKTARANVEGLPDCPPFLNEPQYAAFMFDSTCDYCRRARTQMTIWDFTRCCHKCSADEDKFQRPFDIRWPGCILNEVWVIIPSVWVNVGKRTYKRFKISSVVEMRERHDKVHSHAKEQWFVNKKTETSLRKDHFAKCKTWLNEQAEARSQELNEIRQRRTTAIRKKLTGLGWGEELEKLQAADSEEFNSLPTVKVPKALTDRIWENIKEDIIQWMEAAKADRLKAEFRAAQKARHGILAELYASFMASQPLHAILPPVADVAMTEPFKTIIALPLPPESPVVTAEHFATAVETLPDFVKSWRSSADAKLLAAMRACNELSLQDAQESSLNLATTFFGCARSYGCRAQLPYPHVLVHPCASNPSYCTPHDAFKDLECQPWDFEGNYIEFSPQWYMIARYILEACGLDPDTTTRQQVEDPTFFVECVGCNQKKISEEARTLMTWVSAMNHVAIHRSRREDKGMRVHRAQLSDEDMHRAIQLEADRRENLKRNVFGPKFWICVRCKEVHTWSGFLEHISNSHQIDVSIHEPAEYKDYELHMNAYTRWDYQSVLYLKPLSSIPEEGM